MASLAIEDLQVLKDVMEEASRHAGLAEAPGVKRAMVRSLTEREGCNPEDSSRLAFIPCLTVQPLTP